MNKLTLIKTNNEKRRTVYVDDTYIRKIWEDPVLDRVTAMVQRLHTVMPGYVIKFGECESQVYLDVKKIKGVPASTMPHTDQFIKQIYNFCIDNIQQTWPYAHYDWALSNIIVDGDTMTMCDWDNIAEYTNEEIVAKLDEDLESAFGERYRQVVYGTI